MSTPDRGGLQGEPGEDADGLARLADHLDGLDSEALNGPWALQLAVRYDKKALPAHVAVCAAAARAVVTLLADERARGAWAPYLRRWRDGRIRKLVRRARGARWERCQTWPGVSIEEEGAEVRAFVPLPARPLPPELEELQVSGTQFPRGPVATWADGGHPGAPASRPGEDSADVAGGAGARVITVALRPGLDLTTGKAAAQCAHAAQLAWEQLVLSGESDLLRAWHDDGWRVRVLDELSSEQWAGWNEAPIRVVDAGFTEVDGPTETTRARW